MRVWMFSAKAYDRATFDAANAAHGHEIEYFDNRFDKHAAKFVEDADAVCLFVNDRADQLALERLAERGVGVVALRAAGYNNVDLEVAERVGLRVVRVPAYSPHAVAEHTLALVLALVRKIPRAYNRVRDGNFSLDGLVGFDLHGKTAGVVGTGRIGAIVARLLQAFGCQVLLHDPYPNPELEAAGLAYVPLHQLYAASDIVSLTLPLTPATHHLVDGEAVARMKRGVVLVNTGRGALVDTRALIDGLKSGHIGGVALDVYEEEGPLFFEDRSDQVIADDVFARLLTFPNVLVTAHQAFLTTEALEAIAATTLANLSDLEAGRHCPNLVVRTS